MNSIVISAVIIAVAIVFTFGRHGNITDNYYDCVLNKLDGKPDAALNIAREACKHLRDSE